ncbi:hypothetical protein [Mucilaginibacter koreensis]
MQHYAAGAAPEAARSTRSATQQAQQWHMHVSTGSSNFVIAFDSGATAYGTKAQMYPYNDHID